MKKTAGKPRSNDIELRTPVQATKWGIWNFPDYIEILGSDAAFVRGSWALTVPGDKQQEGKSPHGLFTLVLHKFPGGWKIIHDHTSSAE